MGAGTDRAVPAFLYPEKREKIWNLLYLRAYCFCFFIFMIVQELIQTKIRKTFQEVSS